jgi:micrococcal nuclease
MRALLAILMALGLVSCQNTIPLAGPFAITKVSDGDTVQLASLGTVRLIGIDTPEKFESDKLEREAARLGVNKAVIQAQGRKASEFLKQMLQNQQVYLEQDVEERDRYGRLLGYIYFVSPDGDFNFGGTQLKQVNLEVVRAGYASPLTIPPNVRHAERFVAAAQQARDNKRGLWSLGGNSLPETYRNSATPSGSRCPTGYPVKGNVSQAGNKLYYERGQGRYTSTKPEVCFIAAQDAEAAGFGRGR